MANGYQIPQRTSIVPSLQMIAKLFDEKVRKKKFTDYSKSFNDSIKNAKSLEDFRTSLFNIYSGLMQDEDLSAQEKSQIINANTPLANIKMQNITEEGMETFANKMSSAFEGQKIYIGGELKDWNDINTGGMTAQQKIQYYNLLGKSISKRTETINYQDGEYFYTSAYTNPYTGEPINPERTKLEKSEEGDYTLNGNKLTPKQVTLFEQAKRLEEDNKARQLRIETGKINYKSAVEQLHRNEVAAEITGHLVGAKPAIFIVKKPFTTTNNGRTIYHNVGDRITGYRGTDPESNYDAIIVGGVQKEVGDWSDEIIEENSLKSIVGISRDNIKNATSYIKYNMPNLVINFREMTKNVNEVPYSFRQKIKKLSDNLLLTSTKSASTNPGVVSDLYGEIKKHYDIVDIASAVLGKEEKLNKEDKTELNNLGYDDDLDELNKARIILKQMLSDLAPFKEQLDYYIKGLRNLNDISNYYIPLSSGE